MIRRALIALGVVAVTVALVASLGAGGSSSGSTDYWVELDNAFGLIEGADVKVAGVRAGKITAMEIDRTSMRALVGIDLTREGFGDLRTDAFCETRPQSLIGEYFVDCKPGVKATRLPHGGRVPVDQTASTVPVDLVDSIMRRPYRERFAILLTELGAGLAARGDDLNVTIRRAVPALRETDKVLASLAEQRAVIRDLNDDADKVLGQLARVKNDVGRFVTEAGDTASITASRSADLKRQFQQLPPFLRELSPTMVSLGQAAGEQAPALATLQANADRLNTFLGSLGDFSENSREATKSLAAAARTGRPTARDARPQARRLTRVAKPLPELATNAAIVLEHLDDPKFAVEKDPRSPRGGTGYTGLEAILRYVFFQSQATNVYDGEGHLLKISAFVDVTCAFYADAEKAKSAANEKCKAVLGPTRPGITTPDVTATAKPAAKRTDAAVLAPPAVTQTTPTAPEPTPTTAPRPPTVADSVDGLLSGIIGKLVPGLSGKTAAQQPNPGTTRSLLDFLLGT